MFNHLPITIHSLDGIKYTNDYFKISKPLSNELIKSVKRGGIIEPVLLLKHDDALVPFCGHNRLSAANQAGLKTVPAKIMQQVTIEDFVTIVRIKQYNTTLGTVGKIKSVFLLLDYFHADSKCIKAITQELSLPDSLINVAELSSVMHLPDILKTYIDSKMISPKFVVPLLRLPNEALNSIEAILSKCQLKVNYFINSITMIEDICRAGNFGILKNSIEKILSRDSVKDEDFFDCIYAIRYPEYSQLMMHINDIRNKLSSQGIKVEIPQYLEGDRINVILEVKKSAPLHPLIAGDSNVASLINSIIAML